MELNLDQLRRPEGGSLNTTEIDGDHFVKAYAGDMPRGYEKLRDEARWYRALTPGVASHFPRLISYKEDVTRPWAELRVEHIEHPALAKAILLRTVTPARTEKLLTEVFDFFVEDLYPMRSGEIAGTDLYMKYHGKRMARSLELLAQVPEIRKVITGPGLRVNGVRCPSIGDAVTWLDQHAGNLFQERHQLAAAHGDTHPDNLLVTTEGPLDFWLIDPRGDFLLPPSNDGGKALKALRCAYDLIHYGGYDINARMEGDAPSVSLSVADSWRDHYHAGMGALLRALPKLATAEGVSEAEFKRAVLVAEFAHIVSFASYHANRPEGCDVDRVTAYLSVAALLGHDLMEGAADVTRVLPIWGRAA